MRKLNVVAAGLGWNLLERNSMTEFAGLSFSPAESVFPAVTCVAQASLRTGLKPRDHGVFANGKWFDELEKPLFWEQSAAIVKGERVWSAFRRDGGKVGLFFFQQSLGEEADVVISPAPVHKHSGGMVMSCYTKPAGMDGILEKLCGKFPLWRYWGPFSSPKVGRKCIDWFERMTDIHDVDVAYLYLPTLDYAAQKYGPESPAAISALKEFRRQIERLSDIAARRGASLSVTGDYDISEVTDEPVLPNAILRREGLFSVRTVGGMAYPDFYRSRAFAMCDHCVAILCGPDAARAKEALLATGKFELPCGREAAEVGDIEILLAKKGSWCSYKWWTDRREAPDFASHVDIHNKPGFDPGELFLFCRGEVKGTHGRMCQIAKSEDGK